MYNQINQPCWGLKTDIWINSIETINVYNINTKSWKHPVSGFAKIQICSVLLVPPLVGHRTQTWYASTARWLSYCAYPCCVWSTPNLQFMLNICMQLLCSKWWYFRKHSDTVMIHLKDGASPKNHRLKMSTSVTPDPSKKKNAAASLRNPNLLPRYPTSEGFGPLICAVGCSCWGSPKETIQINAPCMRYDFKKKGMGWFNNVLQRFYSLQQHETDWDILGQ